MQVFFYLAFRTVKHTSLNMEPSNYACDWPSLSLLITYYLLIILSANSNGSDAVYLISWFTGICGYEPLLN